MTLILSFEAVRRIKAMPLGCCLESWGDSVSFQLKFPGIFKCVTDIPASFSFLKSKKKKKKRPRKKAINPKPVTSTMRRVYDGGVLVEQTALVPFRTSYFTLDGNNSFTLWSETQRLNFDVTEHYPVCRVVINFIGSLQNEKGPLDKIPSRSQGCFSSPVVEGEFSSVCTHIPVWHLWLSEACEIIMCCTNSAG